MKNILKAPWIVLIVGALILASCQKKQEDKISDTWRLIRVTVDSTVNWYEIWEFDDGYITFIMENDSTGELDTIGTGEYTVDAGLSNTYINMSNVSVSAYNYTGVWQVLKLNSDIMVILHEDEGWYYREFVKE